ncbi:alpha/beta hydrolase [Flavobacterium sp.]|uniref:alpha/beta fold hydrolase n=1 Tax=Flavobacterium sp. TaxID=239 RepID=UPI00286E0D16|nr:alpha/beta hydrolase [Flavobacterium sp.]
MKIPKSILLTAKFLQFISPKLTTVFAAKLFTTPIKHKTPKRELEMDKNSRQELLFIPKINKSVMVYHYGESDKKILLVHGWSGRGTQLVKFADAFLKLGYSTISFDGPGHGKSGSKTTIMPEFVATTLEMQKQFGPFEAAVGHSLGGMTLLNAVKRGLNLKKVVIIGSGDKIKDILLDFVKNMKLNTNVAERMKVYFENKFEESLETYAASDAAKSVMIPTLVIHDENDYEVPIFCGKNIFKNLQNGELLVTTKLGHRKILGDATVVEKTIQFIHS